MESKFNKDGSVRAIEFRGAADFAAAKLLLEAYRNWSTNQIDNSIETDHNPDRIHGLMIEMNHISLDAQVPRGIGRDQRPIMKERIKTYKGSDLGVITGAISTLNDPESGMTDFIAEDLMPLVGGYFAEEHIPQEEA